MIGICAALAEARQGIAATHPEHVTDWYQGDTVDHLYPTCPGVRHRPLRPGRGALHPEAGDVCGWCLRVWRARQP